jgi:26S proteasome regulatory subunit, ATPase 3, interacting protein
MLASQGVKKSQAEKALDALADKGSIIRKEFGKTKIYFPSQEGLAELEPKVKILFPTSFLFFSFS